MHVGPLLSSLLYNASLVQWNQFKHQYDKRYESAHAEEDAFVNFRENLRRIDEHNEQLHGTNRSSYRMAVNKWSDRSLGQFREYYGLYGNSHESLNDRILDYAPDRELPRAVDWNKLGAVTPSQDQKSCGSCWAFAAVGALEAQIFNLTGLLTALSVQNLVDCSYTNLGCAGGLPILAFRDLLSIGLHTDDAYPYTGREGICRPAAPEYRVHDFYQEENYVSEEKLKEMIATVGPVTALIDASPFGFMHYSEGVFDDPSCDANNSNHAVLIVGYGSEDGLEFWLVKNSWGPNWGMNGFIKIARNRNNTCGVANSNAYPIMQGYGSQST